MLLATKNKRYEVIKRKSVFDDFDEEITYLVSKEISQKNIISFLIKQKSLKNKKGLNQSNLSKYLKTKRINQNES
jgi:hypothetical protein